MVAMVIAMQAVVNIVVVLIVVVVVGRTAMGQLFNRRPFFICGAGHAQISSTGARKKSNSVKGFNKKALFFYLRGGQLRGLNDGKFVMRERVSGSLVAFHAASRKKT